MSRDFAEARRLSQPDLIASDDGPPPLVRGAELEARAAAGDVWAAEVLGTYRLAEATAQNAEELAAAHGLIEQTIERTLQLEAYRNANPASDERTLLLADLAWESVYCDLDFDDTAFASHGDPVWREDARREFTRLEATFRWAMYQAADTRQGQRVLPPRPVEDGARVRVRPRERRRTVSRSSRLSRARPDDPDPPPLAARTERR